MTDSQTDTLQAVAYRNGESCLELAAQEFIFPIVHQEYKIFCHMKPYEPYSVKKFYDLIIPRRKRLSATESAQQPINMTELYEFISDHFIKISGVTLEDGTEPSPEQTKEWLEENQAIKIRIFSDGYVGPRIQPEKTGIGKAVLLFGIQEHRIQDQVRLYSPERKTEELITITHVLSKLSQSEKHQYDLARRVIEDSRHGETYIQANWDVIEQLYDHHVKELGRAVINGEPCTEANKGDRKTEGWIQKVPFLQKMTVMNQISDEVDLKNG